MRSEFDFIDNIRSAYRLGRIGDDCAVLPKDETTDLLVTVDMLVEEIDFRLDWTTPELLGHKALAVSLSDVAAMGGTPKWALLSLGIPEGLWKTGFVDQFYAGWHELARKHDVDLVGGDISRVPDKLVIDSIVGGEAAKGKAVLRSGASPGDLVFVTGFLGGAAAGLHVLSDGLEIDGRHSTSERHLLLRQLQPIPQVNTGKLLSEYGLPTAMLDISDGLSSDIFHLVTASGVGARLNEGSIPIDPAIFKNGRFAGRELGLALNGGEDFELLFTASPSDREIVLDLGFHEIGVITAETGRLAMINAGGDELPLESAGFRHF